MRAPGVGAITFGKLLAQYETPEAVFAAAHGGKPLQGLNTATLNYLRAPDWKLVEKDLRWAEQPGCRIVLLSGPDYPALLKEIPDPPPVLFVRGDKDLLSSPQVAVVGSRNPTAGGTQTAHEFARDLAQAGITVTSGMAVGIDAAGHRGALAATGRTIAVTGTGLDRVYPAKHRELAHQIAERGALVSEFPPGTPPLAENFPRRNRIISGLSLGTLVVEAAVKSGSLITARMAMEQGREVFAIPGSIHNPLARGCHALIRQGAKLVESTQDIIEELGALARFVLAPQDVMAGTVETAPSTGQLNEDQSNLIAHMGFEPTAVDTLVEHSGLTAEEVSSMLVVLELHGVIAPVAGGLYTRLK